MRFFILSDLHLGHDTNKTENILNNFDKFLITYQKDIIKADIIFISGDIFDKLLANNSLDYFLITEWLIKLVLFCNKYNIKLRILEGTPSHDWKQIKNIYSIIRKLKTTIDFKYFDKLDIEYMEDLDIHILYLPDEWKLKIDDIYKDVIKKLHEHKLKKVDVIVMHGAFNYQLPDFLDHTHDPEKYSKLAYGPIIAGHVHNRSMYKNIIIPGSFDRLNHSDDDEDKGGLIIDYNKDKTWNFKYLNNRHALVFKTINVKNKTIEDIKKILNKYNRKEIVHLCLIVGTNDKLHMSLLELQNKYPHIHMLIKKEKQKKNEIINDNKKIIKIINLDHDVIEEHIRSKIKDIHDKDIKNVIMDELNVIKTLF